MTKSSRNPGSAGSNPTAKPTSSGGSSSATVIDDLDSSVIGLSPAVAMASLYVASAQSMGLLFENSVNQSRIGNASADLAVLGGLMKLYDGGKPGSAASIGTAKSDLSELVKLLNSLS